MGPGHCLDMLGGLLDDEDAEDGNLGKDCMIVGGIFGGVSTGKGVSKVSPGGMGRRGSLGGAFGEAFGLFGLGEGTS